MSLPRMRTLKECEQYFKERDPQTKVTYSRLRRWVLSGKIPCQYSGTTKLINLDVLINILNDPTPDKKAEVTIMPLNKGRRICNG